LALPLLEKTLALAINKLGSDHDITLLTVLGLSIAHRKLAKTDEALRLGKQAYTALKAKRGMEYPYTLESVQNLAEVYRAAGKFDQAQALYQELFRDHPNALGVMADLGATLLTRHEYTEAEVLLRECLAASESHHPDAWKTFSRRSMLGAALAGQAHGLKAVDSTTAQDKLTEAEPLLLSGFEGLASRADTIPSYAKPRVTEALQRLVELYEIWDKPDEAAKWQKVLDANAALTAESGSNSPKPIYRDQMVVDLKQKTGR
jgi:tetratricopeptide (TPR) repeat protein